MNNLEPSSSLQDKLREILKNKTHVGYEPDADEAIVQIQTAFQSEGWIDTKKPITGDIHGVGVYEVKGEVGNLEGVEIASINGDTNIMTGQEFYYGFKAELDSTFFLTWHENGKENEAHEILDREQVRKIAAKAAGVSDE